MATLPGTRVSVACALDFAAVVGGDVFDDGQAQAGAAGGSGAGLVDAQATVGDGDFDESAVRAAVEAAADGHRGVRWGVGHRVVEQVGQRGDQQGGVAVEQQPGGGSAVMRMLADSLPVHGLWQR